MALTLARYNTTGGAPAPRVGEDKALFDAVRRRGGRVRHPHDVKVFTSCGLAAAPPSWVMRSATAKACSCSSLACSANSDLGPWLEMPDAMIERSV
jgi:hypothetical protein